jgi:drug/metabolite transporter (DMT)-like permease
VQISSRASDAADATLFGDGMIVLASLVASLGYVAGGKLAGTGYSSWSATFLGVIGGGILLAPILWSAADAPTLTTADLADWVGIAYLAVGVSILGYVAWYWALGVGGVARIGVIQFLQPPLGVVLAVALLDEPVTIPLAVAGALILIGVAVAQKKPANA